MSNSSLHSLAMRCKGPHGTQLALLVQFPRPERPSSLCPTLFVAFVRVQHNIMNAAAPAEQSALIAQSLIPTFSLPHLGTLCQERPTDTKWCLDVTAAFVHRLLPSTPPPPEKQRKHRSQCESLNTHHHHHHPHPPPGFNISNQMKKRV